MKKFATHLRVLCAILIPALGSFSLGGCAAGNFSLTRTVGHWNDHFSLLPRGLIYIVLVIVPVYPITMLVDLLITNTMDFWNGSTKAAMNESYEKNGVLVAIQNSRDPLRRTVITLTPKSGTGAVTTYELRETPRSTIEVYRDGRKQSEAADIDQAFGSLTSQAPALARAS